MARIRVAETATAGFRLIASKPLTVTMWGVAYMLLSLALFAAFWGLGGADLFKTILSAPAGGAPDPTSFTAMSQRLTLMNPLMQLGSLVIRAVLYAAVFRAVLRPRESSFFYLRLGPAELWQALVIFVLAVVIGLSLIPIGLVGAAIGFGGWFGAAAVVTEVIATGTDGSDDAAHGALLLDQDQDRADLRIDGFDNDLVAQGKIGRAHV